LTFRDIVARLIAVAGLAIAAAVVAPGSYAADTVATDVRVGQHAERTRFVLDLSNPVDLQMFLLEAPYRVVIDLPETGWRLPAQPLPSPTGLYKAMRYGLYQPGQSRIVLETSSPVEVLESFYLKPGADGTYRFVLDLGPAEAAAFRATLNRTIKVAADQEIQQNQVAALAVPESAAPEPATEETVVASLSTGVENPLPAGPRKPSFVPEPPRRRVIAIDAGHGGRDPGAIGRSGIYEKHITLAFAKELKAVFEATGRFDVFLVRDRDIFIPLRDRVAKARKVEPDLFISLHADTVANSTTKGLSVYTLSETASDKEAALLAEKENKADYVAGIDFNNSDPVLNEILIDLTQRDSMNESARYANTLIKNARGVTSVLRKTHRFAGFAVLKAPDVPSVLVELGFLSNPNDERNLKSRAYRRKFAEAALRSLDEYFASVQQAHTY